MAGRAHSWDPLAIKDEEPTPQCLQRVQRDLLELHTDPPPGVFVAPEENDLSMLHAVIVGSWGTPLQGGLFHLLIKCPRDYPMVPPRVRFMTVEPRVSFNAHIHGEWVCLSILGTTVGPPWSPALSIASLLVSIQSMMTDGAKESMRHNTIRVAVCGTLEACLREPPAPPPMSPALTKQVLKYFTDNYAKYEDAAAARLPSFSGVLSWLAGATNENYEPLLKRLRDIKRRVDERNQVYGGQASNA
nr:ubiquitin-conjugating enzyme E2 Z-like [Dermacentor andersoni]